MSPRRGRQSLFGWAMAGPYVVLLVIFGLGPIGYAVYESLQPTPYKAGTGVAYKVALTDFRFLPAVQHICEFLAIYLPTMMLGVVVLALLVDVQSRRFGLSIRLMYALPGVVSGSASVLLWYVMLQPTLSPFGPALRAIGEKSQNDVFQNGHLALIFAAMAFATGFGQWVIILFGSLQNISTDVLEAARIDGAGAIHTALWIKLPMISRYVIYMLVLTFATGLQIFIEPALLNTLTSAGSQTWSPNQLGLFFAFNNADFASAAAVSLVLLVVCVLVSAGLIMKGRLFETEVSS